MNAKETMRQIKEIVSRACEAAEWDGDRQDLESAVFLCHAGPCPLRLKDMAQADGVNQAHDVFGIARHYDPTANTLMDCFWPRFAAPQPESTNA